jgi:hypothetical protein
LLPRYYGIGLLRYTIRSIIGVGLTTISCFQGKDSCLIDLENCI